MGLFGKKENSKPRVCAVCGSKLGLLELLPVKLTDGYLCGKCKKTCSPYIDFAEKVDEKWSSEDVKNHRASLEEQKARLEKEFTETDCIVNSKSGDKEGEKILRVDRNHGWFTVGNSNEIFDVKQIESRKVDIFTLIRSEDDIHLRRFEAPRPDMRVPDRSEDLSQISVKILLKDHPYANSVEVRIASSGAHFGETYNKFLDNVYSTAAEVYDLIDSL